MLVFFLHGVATRDSEYAKPLQKLLQQAFIQRKQALPHFYAGFWGNVLKQTDQMWNWIHQDLLELQKNHAQVSTSDVFRYQDLREGFISQFFGDALTYFNTDRGFDVRDTIADQLYKFLRHHPDEKDLHLVSHSLGTVILWDALFSDRFAADDPAYTIRSLIDARGSSQKVRLSSLTTMGSPILFFNMMLGTVPEQIKAFTATYQSNPFRWLNILHASDIIAYPLQASLNLQSMPNFFFKDKFIWADANPAEKAARLFGQNHTAMALAVSDAHNSYWRSRGTGRLVASNLLGDYRAIEAKTLDLE